MSIATRRAVGVLLRCLAACLLLAGGLAAAQGSYYPDTPGVSWTYSNGETQTLGGPREVLGDSRIVLTHAYQGVPVSEEYLSFGDGVRSHGTAAGGEIMAYDPPLIVYPPSPLEPGDTWESTTQVNGVDITLAAEVLGVQGIETPAGRFNALRLRQTTLTSSGGRTALDVYFVPTVGVVRFVTQDGTRIDLIEHLQ
ncbi:MAG: hypothetical protein U5K81_05120 [Trueperaceae bacterium]|nr:hypothetical protein [Trueperaceae bacterium]